MFTVSTCQIGNRVASNAFRLTSLKVPAGTFQTRGGPLFPKKFTSSTKIAVQQKSGGFVAWYESHLDARPVLTKMVTGCFLWGIGDAVGQVVPHWASKEDNNKKEFAYDLPRTLRAAFFGFALHAPTSHVHFNFLEWMTQRAGITGYAIPFFKAFMEQVCVGRCFIPVNVCEMSFFGLLMALLFCFRSLSTGAGYPIHCITVPWQDCKDSPLRNATSALKIIYGIHRWLNGAFGFLFSLSTFSLPLSGTNSTLF